MPDNLICNRESPVPLNFGDLNRIETWCAYLADYLQLAGYVIAVTTKTWAMADIPWRSEIDRIRNNVTLIYTTFHTLPDWRAITFTNSLDFGQVNAIEWDLQTIYNWLKRMADAFIYSNEVFSGEV